MAHVRPPRGFALGMVMVLLVALSVAIASALALYKSSSTTSAAMLDRRQTFYVCDGAARLIARAAQAYADAAPSPTDTALKAAVCAAGGSAGSTCSTTPLPWFVPEGYEVDAFTVETQGAPSNQLLESGPYAGMSARVLPLRIEVAVRESAGEGRCSVEQEQMLATFGLFGFTVFGDDDLAWSPERDMLVNGRVHAGGDLCLGGRGDLGLQKVTAAGGVYKHSHSACGPTVSSMGSVELWTGSGSFPTFGTSRPYPSSIMKDLNSGNDHRTSGWATSSVSLWNRQVLDSAHGVKPLVLPEAKDARVQPGVDADGGPVDNAGSLRFLLDPLLDDDPTTVRQAKLACQADVRIVNGVWYVRRPPSPSQPCGGWPGIPVWSDHPGRFTLDDARESAEAALVGNEAVGQLDVSTNRGWSSLTTSPKVPRRYSWYRYNTSTSGQEASLVYDASWPRPVISYGGLVEDSGRLKPGHWLSSADAGDVCGSTVPSSSAGVLTPFDDTSACGGGEEAGLANAARSGFLDPEILMASPDAPSGAAEARARILPLNFDVEAFRAALKDTSTGELGSYFGGAGRIFNGIVYISATWTGSLDGFGSTTDHAGGDAVWPAQGDATTADDDDQPDRSADEQSEADQPALPYPLCASALGSGAVAGDAMTTAPTGGSAFLAPDCADYAEGGARVNAVRLFGGATLSDPTDTADPLPMGLTVVTPLPLYVQGPYNSDSDASSASATPWVPAFLAGDHLRLLSDRWSDERVPWGDPDVADHNGSAPSSGDVSRVASDTTYHFAALTGQVPNGASRHGGGVDGALTLLEDWDGERLRFRGSLVIGFSPVYARWAHRHAARLPRFRWSHDEHLSEMPHQPPGAPLLHQSATRAWRR